MLRIRLVVGKLRRSQCAHLPLVETLESPRLFSASSSIILHNDLKILKNSASASSIGVLLLSQIKKAYGFDNIGFNNGAVKGDGSGQTIAIVDAYNAPLIQSDLGVFDLQFGMVAVPPSFKVVNQNGGSKLPANDPGWAGEISLDVEWGARDRARREYPAGRSKKRVVHRSAECGRLRAERSGRLDRFDELGGK